MHIARIGKIYQFAPSTSESTSEILTFSENCAIIIIVKKPKSDFIVTRHWGVAKWLRHGTLTPVS